MTYRERRERRADLREEWSDKRRKKSTAAFESSASLANNIPLGQPILVGHHSEKRARRDQQRIQSGMNRGIEHGKMANHHDQAATTIRRQLDTSIYSDDTDAAERLREKLEGMEAKRDRCKAINGWLRKNRKAHGLATLTLDWRNNSTETINKAQAIIRAVADALKLTPEEINNLVSALKFNIRIGFPPYVLSNLSGNITRARKRLEQITEENDWNNGYAAYQAEADSRREIMTAKVSRMPIEEVRKLREEVAPNVHRSLTGALPILLEVLNARIATG